MSAACEQEKSINHPNIKRKKSFSYEFNQGTFQIEFPILYSLSDVIGGEADTINPFTAALSPVNKARFEWQGRVAISQEHGFLKNIFEKEKILLLPRFDVECCRESP